MVSLNRVLIEGEMQTTWKKVTTWVARFALDKVYLQHTPTLMLELSLLFVYGHCWGEHIVDTRHTRLLEIGMKEVGPKRPPLNTGALLLFLPHTYYFHRDRLKLPRHQIRKFCFVVALDHLSPNGGTHNCRIYGPIETTFQYGPLPWLPSHRL